jgi:hypothetical protein
MYSEKTNPMPPGDRAYPCPCRRQAHLVPIYLTEAFGCDRCPQMFILQEDGKLVEQLTGGYPQACAWRWTGNHWQLIHPPQPRDHLVIRTLAPLVLLVAGWFLVGQWLVAPFSWLYLLVGILVITLVLPWLSHRFGRRR